ncbi:MAG: FecR domain-containing protein [Firmicutes bacterium]|nr:FecR domain-containing protein [Bacillota bacterium]
MKKNFAVVLALSMIMGFACSSSSFAQNKDEVVAQVSGIKGKLQVQREGKSAWENAFVKMPDYLNDKLKTDSSSVAAVEFVIGGQVAIDKGTTIEITGEREAKDVTKRSGLKKIILKAGSIWAKITKQQEELQIQTQGGVLGIEGTEFVVETQEKKDTTVYCLEGKVAFKTEDKVYEVSEGQKLVVPYQEVPVVTSPGKEKVRIECEERHQEMFNSMVKEVVYVALAYAAPQAAPYAGLAIECVTEPNEAAKNIAAAAVEEYVPYGGILGSVINSQPSKKKPKIDFICELSPSETEVEAFNPDFAWGAFEGAGGYTFALGDNPEMKYCIYIKELNATSFAYPQDAPKLKSGNKYYWRIIAVDKDKKPVSKWSQSYFTINAKEEAVSASTSVEEPKTQEPLKPLYPAGALASAPESLAFKWSPMQGAAKYVITVSSSEDMKPVILSETIDGAVSEFKVSDKFLKSLKKGIIYYWQVKALDGNGSLMGKAGETAPFTINP